MDDTEALTLIQEGIQGNGAALAEYGVKLDEATVKAQAMPVIMELGQALLPVLTDVLGTVFQAAIPVSYTHLDVYKRQTSRTPPTAALSRRRSTTTP